MTDKEQDALSSIAQALHEAKDAVKDMQDALKVLPVEVKASAQGRKPHKNEILLRFSIAELKAAIKIKKEMNSHEARERIRTKRGSSVYKRNR